MKCVKCHDEINPLRVQALPHTKICIGCAEGSVKRKAGMPVTYGTGDHTWTETVIMDADDIKVEPTEFNDRLTEQDDAPSETP